ncbi:hypothetical protein HNR19_000796 [Nocardioides thalensis]|uniref:WD40 repeat domain-containing protein n=1 Tax=Nocardioides thalensis TaxID=1914755 RepID=A0A853C0F8_9ACTN|nr:hypothetical protein [Nocardioides thalensis]NYJ00098.1 hypothetical protein [Nocardioides thalensis]
MSEQRLQDLLEERVADLPPVDLVGGALARASDVRRRRWTVAGVVVAVVAVVGAGTVVATGGGDEPAPPPATSPTNTGPVPVAERAGSYGGVPVWWAPSTEDEEALPEVVGSGLPAEIDLSAGAPPVPAGVRAVALFQVWGDEPGRVVVVGADGTSYSLDVGFPPVTDEGGNESPPVTAESLSPDGRYAFFAQDRSLEVYDFEQAVFTKIDMRPGAAPNAYWTDDGLLSAPVLSSDSGWFDHAPTGEPVGASDGQVGYRAPKSGDDAYGPVARTGSDGARGMFLEGPVDVPDAPPASAVDALGGGGLNRPEALLAFARSGTDAGRWLQCCPPVGWLDADTVLFESRHAEARILAWRVGTADVFRVSDIRGWTPGEESYVGSFADLAGAAQPDGSDASDDAAPQATPGGTYAGAPVWWAPSPADEADLPLLPDSPLPAEIDLSTATGGEIGQPVLGLFGGRRNEAFVLTVTGRVVRVDTSRLERVADEGGNVRSPVSSYGLSPDGRYAFFIQESSLEVRDFLTGEWTTIDTPDWLAEGARWSGEDEIWVPIRLGESSAGTIYGLDGEAVAADVDWVQPWSAPGDQPFGPTVSAPDSVAQAAFLRGPVRGGTVSNPQAIVASLGTDRSVLALDFGAGTRDVRPKGCCLALSWIDDDTLLLSSASDSGQRLLAWDVGTSRLFRVSEVLGEGWVAAIR